MWIKLIKDFLKEMNVDSSDVQLTSSESMFIWRNINGYSVYFEYFIITENNDKEELICNIYKNGNHILAYGGECQETLNEIRKIL